MHTAHFPALEGSLPANYRAKLTLWLVNKTRATFSASEKQNQNQSQVACTQHIFPRLSEVCWPITERSSAKLKQTQFTFDIQLNSNSNSSNSNNLFIPRKFNVRFQMRLTILNPLQFSNQIYNSLQFFHQIKCWFLRRGENRSTRRKTSRSRVENQQTQPTYDAESGNRTRDTLVEGERSRHCANPALQHSVEKHSIHQVVNYWLEHCDCRTIAK